MTRISAMAVFAAILSSPHSMNAQLIGPRAGGTFTFDNGSGGPDVGAFKASFSESLTTPLIWTNASAIVAIDRAKGQSITWTGGIPESYVSISGYSYVNLYFPTALGMAPLM